MTLIISALTISCEESISRSVHESNGKADDFQNGII